MEVNMQAQQDYYRIEQALAFLETHFREQPTLADIAASVQLSEFHFQKLFGRWVGISPKRFLQYITKEYAKKRLETSHNLLEVSFDVGLSGSGRLYDLFVTCEAMSPGEFKRKGEGLTIAYGFHPTPFGECLVATTDRGVCGLKFVRESRHSLLDWLANQWSSALRVESPDQTRAVAARIFERGTEAPSTPIHLFVKGSNFQIKVWEALLQIPFGSLVSYEDVARRIGTPKAVRAVGTAIGKNPIPFLIPCHRVIRKMGDFGNYGEGPLRKKAIIAWEAARFQAEL